MALPTNSITTTHRFPSSETIKKYLDGFKSSSYRNRIDFISDLFADHRFSRSVGDMQRHYYLLYCEDAKDNARDTVDDMLRHVWKKTFEQLFKVDSTDKEAFAAALKKFAASVR